MLSVCPVKHKRLTWISWTERQTSTVVALQSLKYEQGVEKGEQYVALVVGGDMCSQCDLC